MRVEFTRADVVGNEKVLIESDYVLTVKNIIENGQRKWTEIRMKTGFIEVVQEPYDEVKAKLPSTLQ